MTTMATYPRKRRELVEPTAPTFVVDLRRRIDVAVLRNDSALTTDHSYTGWEAGHATVKGWSTRIVLRARPSKVIEIWFDALDQDVCLYGTAEYREWKWEPGDSAAVSACAEELDQIVDAFAKNQLAESAPPRNSHLPAFALSVIAVGAGIARLRRRRR